MSLSLEQMPLTPELVNSFRKVLRQKGRLKCRIVSDSMLPVLEVGDIIEIEPVRKIRKLRRFDLLVFFDGNQLMCHFLWKKSKVDNNQTIITRSLKRCLINDPSVYDSFILGKVISHHLPWRYRLIVLVRNLLDLSRLILERFKKAVMKLKKVLSTIYRGKAIHNRKNHTS